MNRVQDYRWEQLRAVEADLLSPPPEDPFTSFPSGWSRAATLTDADWKKRLAHVVPAPRQQSSQRPLREQFQQPVRQPAQQPPQQPVRPHSPIYERPPSRARGRRTPPPPLNLAQVLPRVHRAALPMRNVNGRRASRAFNNQNPVAQPAGAPRPQPVPLPVQMAPAQIPAANPVQFPAQNNENRAEIAEPSRRRPLSPTQLPGVRAIPKNYNHFFRGLLTPGDYFAKSQTRYLGPFEEMPTEETLPRGDDYIILQRMGRLPESGKSIFRQVGNVSN